MRRYEDMNDLLQHVRERLAAVDPDDQPKTDENYTALLNQTILLYHEAEQLRTLLGSGQLATLSPDEREEIRGLVGKSAAAVQDCDRLLR
ncbi:MAG TPA: hypothetical protein VFA78_03635 [Chloroflexota bacterium]|nr:hypothetical protein [Chloroflexota bacterium]